MGIDSVAGSAEPRDVHESFKEEQHSALEHNVDEQRSKIYVPPQILVFKPVVSAPLWTIYDHAGDGKIRDVFTSSQFLKTTLDYSCEGTNYKTFLIYNPEKLSLKDKDKYPTLFSNRLIFHSDPKLPPFLKKHFEELSNQKGIDPTDILFQDPNYPSYKLSVLEELEPVKYDPAGDGKIRDAFSSSQFLKTTLDYNFEGTDYKIFLLYNPEKLPLKDKSNFSAQFSKPLVLFSKPELPFFLVKHIEELCTQKGINLPDIFSPGSYYPSNKLSILQELEPVKYDPAGDGKIREVFTSSQFLKTTLDYNFEGTDYKIFLLHNPEKLPLQGKGNYPTQLSKPLVLFSDPKLPPFLKSHFEDLCNQNSINLTDILFENPYYPTYRLSFLQELELVKNTVPDKVPTADQAPKQREEIQPSLIERLFNWALGR